MFSKRISKVKNSDIMVSNVKFILVTRESGKVVKKSERVHRYMLILQRHFVL